MLLFDAVAAFRRGRQLADSKTWKERGVAVSALAAFLAAVIGVARGMGYDVGVSHEDLEAIALGIILVVNVFNSVIHVTTTTKIGLAPDTGGV